MKKTTKEEKKAWYLWKETAKSKTSKGEEKYEETGEAQWRKRKKAISLNMKMIISVAENIENQSKRKWNNMKLWKRQIEMKLNENIEISEENNVYSKWRNSDASAEIRKWRKRRKWRNIS